LTAAAAPAAAAAAKPVTAAAAAPAAATAAPEVKHNDHTGIKQEIRNTIQDAGSDIWKGNAMLVNGVGTTMNAIKNDLTHVQPVPTAQAPAPAQAQASDLNSAYGAIVPKGTSDYVPLTADFSRFGR
jgi:pyruvate/2-oxoglutarate dehydrogenase complex dihydrolipoamide acyltransferase (E2) component